MTMATIDLSVELMHEVVEGTLLQFASGNEFPSFHWMLESYPVTL